MLSGKYGDGNATSGSILARSSFPSDWIAYSGCSGITRHVVVWPVGRFERIRKDNEGILARVLPGEARTHGAFLILVGLVLIGLSFYVSDAGDVNAHRA